MESTSYCSEHPCQKLGSREDLHKDTIFFFREIKRIRSSIGKKRKEKRDTGCTFTIRWDTLFMRSQSAQVCIMHTYCMVVKTLAHRSLWSIQLQQMDTELLPSATSTRLQSIPNHLTIIATHSVRCNCFSFAPNHPTASQQYFSLVTNQHQQPTIAQSWISSSEAL